MTKGSHCAETAKIMPKRLSITVMSPKPSGRELGAQQNMVASRDTLTGDMAKTSHQKEPDGLPNQKEAIMTTKRHNTVSPNVA
jgi:hypothetical protein